MTSRAAGHSGGPFRFRGIAAPPRCRVSAEAQLRILVTGGAGFIGSRVAAAYREAGHYVAVLDDLSTGRPERLPSGCRFFRGDLVEADLSALLAEERIEAVSHHAAHVNVRASVRDPLGDARVNVLGTLRLLEACRGRGVTRVIFASTGGAIYGEPRGPSSSEDEPTEPVSPYGIAKLAAENYLRFYRAEHGFETVVLRYANVYGPGQDGAGEAGVVAIFAQAMLAGQAPVIHGDGLQSRDFVFVEDCVRANVVALSGPSGLWNVGTGVETTVSDLYHRIAAALDFSGAPRHDGPAPGEQRRSVLDGEKIRRDLGLPLYTPLDEGLARTIAWFRRRSATAVENGETGSMGGVR
jgi:UDP-glucose 4-epimerase